jgi:UDP-glucose 4-epimerase
MSKKILVTGGAGFIGSHTVVSLAEAGFKPVIVDDFSNSEPSIMTGLKEILGYEVPCHVLDCNNYAAIRQILRDEKIEGVIHFAAFKAVGESMQEPLAYYRNNLGSLITMLDSMLAEGISNFIFSSSCTVYGEPDTPPVTEETPVKPATSVYGNTKQVGEVIVRDVAAAKPLKALSLRYFNPIGAHPSALIGELPRGIPSNLVPFVTQTAVGLRKSLTIFGDDYPTSDGTCVRDFIHVMDLAEAHVAALRIQCNARKPNFTTLSTLVLEKETPCLNWSRPLNKSAVKHSPTPLARAERETSLLFGQMCKNRLHSLGGKPNDPWKKR